ncbi:hypothetical protein KQI49_16740 [Virgibacillus sp. MSJ-26]|uniref:hypothetical protein n=1 Tax=Virgibacillus sp. MSJ-26 TaxID=2841522 RepID=UPI001C10E21B|nr:hypothetical protein [Virgibacillus sp. MSJ-26]MBU5468472.1 hypothetical protein [Virgibacillus sp. MSJ-26]
MGVASLIGILIYLFPFIAAVLVMVWLYRIKQNSDEQVEQNKKIIRLLEKDNLKE